MDQQTIGDYRLIRKIGQGSMGTVYEGKDPGGRRVAIKLMHKELLAQTQVAARFLNEAKVAWLVRHPGLVEICESGRLADGSPYLVMEYLEGVPLTRRLSGDRRGLLVLARQIAEALAAAHKGGVAHRDLKPDNIVVVKDAAAPGGTRARLLDFGLAKLREGEGGDGATWVETQIGTCMGTPTYMAPEQCRGSNAVSGQADVYALGVILYRMLLGRAPFVGDSHVEVMAMHLYQEPVALWRLDGTIPTGLSLLVQRMLAKDPAARPTMQEVAESLAPFAGGRAAALPRRAAAAKVRWGRAGAAALAIGATEGAAFTGRWGRAGAAALHMGPTEMVFKVDPAQWAGAGQGAAGQGADGMRGASGMSRMGWMGGRAMSVRRRALMGLAAGLALLLLAVAGGAAGHLASAPREETAAVPAR